MTCLMRDFFYIDGMLTTVSHLNAKEFANIFKLARSIHFMLIPCDSKQGRLEVSRTTTT